MLYVQILKDNDSHHAFSQLTRFVDDVDDDENSSVINKKTKVSNVSEELCSSHKKINVHQL